MTDIHRMPTAAAAIISLDSLTDPRQYENYSYCLWLSRGLWWPYINPQSVYLLCSKVSNGGSHERKKSTILFVSLALCFHFLWLYLKYNEMTEPAVKGYDIYNDDDYRQKSEIRTNSYCDIVDGAATDLESGTPSKGRLSRCKWGSTRSLNRLSFPGLEQFSHRLVPSSIPVVLPFCPRLETKNRRVSWPRVCCKHEASASGRWKTWTSVSVGLSVNAQVS